MLYTGTNYHPHDWAPERWKTDIMLMQRAGFQVVRLGHLCWDSYEPADGTYTFEWFDQVMDAFHEAGIQVFLDVSMRPAPQWVHKICPGCNIVDKNGMSQPALRRYMEDVADEEYQYYALRFARKIAGRYKDHPALIGFGLCNEQGDGPISYSHAAVSRFRQWLQKKYGTVENLNRAWNTRRWSRRLSSFADVELQENELSKGAPEAWLDMKRFYGDGVLDFMKKLKDTVEKEAPGIFHSSNHVAESDFLGFDYLKECKEWVDFPGFGFYPNLDPEDENTLMTVLMYMQHRLAELGKPMWCLEFQTGNFGCYEGPKGLLRMYAFLCLLYRSQIILAWTWRSMLGGEEQYYFGLLDHDGTCSRKYEEFAQIASDFKKLEAYSLPYLPKPAAAVAYCYENIWVYQYSRHQFCLPYKQQMTDVLKIFHRRNLDFNMVDLRNMQQVYRILIIPGHAIMTQEMAETVKKHVAEGGIAVMNGYSAKVNENNVVFDTPQPGLLRELFGVRATVFHRAGILASTGGVRQFSIRHEEDTLNYKVSYWEKLELYEAEAYAVYVEGEEGCAISVNRYGKGKAFYISAETNTELLGWLYDEIAREEGLQQGIQTPKGLAVRKIADREWLMVNTTAEPMEVVLPGRLYGVLRESWEEGSCILEPFDGELFVE